MPLSGETWAPQVPAHAVTEQTSSSRVKRFTVKVMRQVRLRQACFIRFIVSAATAYTLRITSSVIAPRLFGLGTASGDQDLKAVFITGTSCMKLRGVYVAMSELLSPRIR